jgi:potassium-transporting ATPase KdpC subunit
MKTMLNELRIAVLASLCLGLVVCGFYPVLVWLAAQVIFPYSANGSFVEIQGKPVGSSLIGQPFSHDGYFHPRPSAAGNGYDAVHSGADNLGPISKKLIDSVTARIARYREINGLGRDTSVPADAVTASGSGLDPHISVGNALLQSPRVAHARGISIDDLKRQMDIATQDRQLGIFGEPRVNILLLNLALDGKILKQ